MHTPHLSWDRRYRKNPAPVEPSALLVQFSDLLPSGGRALDVACGGGRNALFLARHGLRVVALDRSRPALEQGKALAATQKAEVAWVQADLSRVSFAGSTFDVILCFLYRDLHLYSSFQQWLRPGGLLLYESFSREQLGFDSGPRNAAHLLEPGELLREFGNWEILFYREVWKTAGVASLAARKPLPG